MRDGHEIPVLGKALEIVEYIGAHPGRVTQPELQEALGIPQATCYRIMATLIAHNWLVKTNGNHYDISTGMVPVVRKAMFQLEKYKVLQPILEHLSRKVGYSSKLSVRDGMEQVNVLCAKAPWDIALTTVIGSRDSLLTGGSVGIVLLSAMTEKELSACCKKMTAEEFRKINDRIQSFRKDGFCFNPATTDPKAKWHVDALSVPIKSESNTVLGVLTVLSTPGDIAAADWKKLIAEMNKTVEFCMGVMQ